MNETQQRIKAYQEMLPSLKEKVVAMALLLALSLTMVTSASFAWLTISKAPAVTGVNTTVAANGALEIALVNPEGTVPGESKVGDSFAAEGQNVVAANMTWGNLINLSDPSYGLNHLALRPAQLNYASLLVSPLYGAMYDGDGRITQLSSNFGYGTWNSEHSRFMITNDKGVRAISSVTIEAVGFAEQVYQARSKAEASNLQAGSKYLAITQNGDWMNSLSTIMGTFMTARMNSDDASLSNPTVESKDVQNLTDIFEAFIGAYEAQADAMVDLANYQLFLLNNSETGTTPYTKYTRETLLAKSETTLEQGVKIVGLNQLKTDLNKLYPSYEELLALKELGSVSWADSGISDIVNKLMDVGTCKLDDTPINNIGVSNAMGYLDGNTHNAYITNGLLFNFEKINGAHCEVKNLEVSAKVKRLGITIPASISVNITTTAPLIGEYSGNLEYADGLNQGAQGERVAQDTYGLAIDLWVRTNAEGSYLTLEGNVLTETKTVRSTGKDANGNEVELYTLERTSTDEETGETSNFTAIVYKEVDENGRETGNWISANNYAVVELADGEVPIEKYDEVKNVIGYEGVNRIWAENDMLSTDSTSQGSGSCYVYYADTPEDQAQSLRLLESFNVAFIDDQGEYLANAYMDTTEYYAENGRVIVPLKLDTNDSINLGTDYTGETTYAITALQSAVPKRITAIVYLDGTKLTNDDVLAAADIQGQLNIQFGSSTSLVAIENEKLENAIRRVTASVDKTKFNYDTATEPMTTTVTLNIEGEDPTNVTAFFMRAINSTQGSREDVMQFTKNENGTWTSSYTFTTPGNYILRTIQMDGKEYVLEECPAVEVEGFTVEFLRCMEADGSGHINVMTAANSSAVNLELKFATNDESKMPKNVQGRFLRSDGSAINIDFTYNPTNQLWTGSGTFISSGEYTLQYLVLDGNYEELEVSQQKTATIYLGMKVAVYTDSSLNMEYKADLTDDQKTLKMKVEIMDNTGKQMIGLQDATLTYVMDGSSVVHMDTDLKWNAGSNYYEGDLHVEFPGIFKFGNVKVGSNNTITNATIYPVFTILSPDPAEYDSFKAVESQFAPNNDALMTVYVKNSAAASAKALIKNLDNNTEKEVIGVRGATNQETMVTEWNFVIPTDANGYQDGNWKLVEIDMWDVFNADGVRYTEESPLTFNVASENIVTKVISRVYISFAEGQSKVFGKDANGNITSVFADRHTVSGLNVDVSDFEGKDLNSIIEDVTLKFELVNGSSKNYGGYEGVTNANEGATVTVKLIPDSTGTHYVQSEDVKLLYAGQYKTTFSFKVNGSTTSYSGDHSIVNTPQFEVWSITPTVKFSNVDPSGSVEVDKTNADSHTTETLPAWTDTYATAYIKCTKKSGSCGSSDTHTYTKPTVTMTLAGIGNASEASVQFASTSGTVYIYDGNTQTSTYKWTANGDCARSIGYISGDTKTVAGTLTANALKLVYNNTTCTVPLSEITIYNPY